MPTDQWRSQPIIHGCLSYMDNNLFITVLFVYSSIDSYFLFEIPLSLSLAFPLKWPLIHVCTPTILKTESDYHFEDRLCLISQRKGR